MSFSFLRQHIHWRISPALLWITGQWKLLKLAVICRSSGWLFVAVSFVGGCVRRDYCIFVGIFDDNIIYHWSLFVERYQIFRYFLISNIGKERFCLNSKLYSHWRFYVYLVESIGILGVLKVV